MKIEHFEDIEACQPLESPSALRLVDEPFGCEPFDLELTAERLRA